MKSLYYTLCLSSLFLFGSANILSAQFFVATFEQDGMDIVFKITPNSGGGDINTGWSDIEFFVRYPDSQSGTFSFGAITINTTDFPGIAIPNNGPDAQGSEIGFENNWFGTSFSATASRLYSEGIEYEVFRISLDVDPSIIGMELVHNEFFSPTYLALTAQSGADLTNNGGNKFYGIDVQTCNTCPGPSNNDILPLPGTPAPIELLHFIAQKNSLRSVLLSWTTIQEINSDYFELQKLNDGLWEELARIPAQGFSQAPQNYEWLDQNIPLKTKENSWLYYRLKMVDQDASFQYSTIRNVFFKQDHNFHISPNPFMPGQTLTISWDSKTPNAEVYWKIFNARGQLVKEWKNEKVLEAIDQQISLDLPAGVYWIQVREREFTSTKQLVIQG